MRNFVKSKIRDVVLVVRQEITLAFHSTLFQAQGKRRVRLQFGQLSVY